MLELIPTREFLGLVEDAWYYETKGDLDLTQDPEPRILSAVLDLQALALWNVRLDQGGQFNNEGNEVPDTEITNEDIAGRIAQALNTVFFGGPR